MGDSQRVLRQIRCAFFPLEMFSRKILLRLLRSRFRAHVLLAKGYGNLSVVTRLQKIENPIFQIANLFFSI